MCSESLTVSDLGWTFPSPRTGGEDYEAFSQEIILQPEENSINVTIPVFSDGVLEARELFDVFLSGGLGVVVASGGGEVTVEIVDEDGKWYVPDLNNGGVIQ